MVRIHVLGLTELNDASEETRSGIPYALATD